MREGKMTDAKQAAQQMTENPMWMRPLLQGCLNQAPPAEMHKLAETAQKDLLPEQNSALKYYQGALLAACGQKEIAFAFLRAAVDAKYCAREALELDPLLAGVRGDPEFKGILQAATECEQSFRKAEGKK